MKDVAEFTELLLQEIRRSSHLQVVAPDSEANPLNIVYQGTVLLTRKDKNLKWYGFIKKLPENVFFHSAQSPGLDFSNLRGQTVEYGLSNNIKDGSEIAVNVKIIEPAS